MLASGIVVFILSCIYFIYVDSFKQAYAKITAE